MEKEAVAVAVKTVKEETSKAGRKFAQAIDLIIVLKAVKAKSQNSKIDTTATMPNQVKVIKTCAFVDKDMQTQSNGIFSTLIMKDDFGKYDKKAIRKVVKNNDLFLAEASIMPQVAAKFGKPLASRNKMPNPKTNTIITPATNLKEIVAKSDKMVRISTAKNNAIAMKVGDQNMDDERVVDNVLSIYSAVKAQLPNGDAAIRRIYLKPTMGKLVTI